jgi:hypothetical protein
MKHITSKGIIAFTLGSMMLLGAGCLPGFQSKTATKRVAEPASLSEFKPPQPPAAPSAEPEIPKEAEKIPKPY